MVGTPDWLWLASVASRFRSLRTGTQTGPDRTGLDPNAFGALLVVETNLQRMVYVCRPSRSTNPTYVDLTSALASSTAWATNSADWATVFFTT